MEVFLLSLTAGLATIILGLVGVIYRNHQSETERVIAQLIKLEEELNEVAEITQLQNEKISHLTTSNLLLSEQLKGHIETARKQGDEMTYIADHIHALKTHAINVENIANEQHGWTIPESKFPTRITRKK